MTQLDLHNTNPGTLCADCINRKRSATWCKERHSMRTESHPTQRDVSCTGHTTEDQAEQRQAGALGAAVLLVVGLLAASYYVPPASGQQGGYPAHYVTRTDSPMVTPACWPGCLTNTPVPPYGWGATAEAEQPAATPSPMSYVEWLPVRLWLPMVARRDAR